MNFLVVAMVGVGLTACGSVETLSGEVAQRPIERRAPAPRGGPVDLTAPSSQEDGCVGAVVARGRQAFAQLADGSLATLAPLRPVANGAPYAYHPANFDGGAIMHRCNVGEVSLRDGTVYEGASSNAVCTGRFERDVARIEAAGWTDDAVGAVRWHGIAATNSARIGDRLVPRAVPVLREDGFYASQTALQDEAYAISAPERYVDASRIPFAVVRRDQGIPLGSFGVAWRVRGCGTSRDCRPVPFVVADLGPKAGAGSLALAHEASGYALPDRFDAENRYLGQARDGEVLTVFFLGRGRDGPLEEASIKERAAAAFNAWGGEDRLYRCRRVDLPRLDGGDPS